MNLFQLLKNTVTGFIEDDCPTLATAIAFSAFFSIFPLLLGGVALAGVLIEDPEVHSRIVNEAVAYMPAAGEFVQTTIEGVIEKREGVGAISALLLLISGRGVFAMVVHGLNQAFDAPAARGFISTMLLVIALVFGGGTLLLLSLAATAVMQALGDLAVSGVGPFGDLPFWGPLQVAVAVAVSFLMFLLFYRVAPHIPVGWRDVWPGALAAALLFEAAKLGFVVYVRNFTNYEAVYGTIGAVIVLLTWCYFSAMILLFGGELSSEYRRLRRMRLGERAVDRPAPVLMVTGSEPAIRRVGPLVGTAAAVGAAIAAANHRRRTGRLA